MSYQSLLNRAKKEAAKSKHMHKVGACLYKGGSLLSSGYNQVRLKSIGRTFTNYPESLHAERDACSKTKRIKLKGSTICVVRVNNQGKFLLAKPCSDCMDLLTSLGVRKIIYSTSVKPFYKEIRIW